MSGCFCSKKCRGGKSAAAKKRRQEREGGRRITPRQRLSVYERDGWKCQICGDPVDRDRIGTTEASAPSIDHRLPLAAGGQHEEANWQTAHLYCNNVKQDQVGFEFWVPELGAVS